MSPDRRDDDDTRGRLGAIDAGYRSFAKRVFALLAVLVAVQLGLGVLSIYLIDQNDRRAEESAETVSDLRKLSLSNCTDIREQNQGLYKLLLILEAIVKNGALGPDAEVRIEEPKKKECHAGDVVPSESPRPR